MLDDLLKRLNRLETSLWANHEKVSRNKAGTEERITIERLLLDCAHARINILLHHHPAKAD